MKRFHLHLAVDNLEDSIHFYTQLFGQPPAREQPDYAKWMLDDPQLNFAISSRGHTTGVNHLGIQVETAEELAALSELAEKASAGAVLDQRETACCYARSNKHWTLDPQGIAWEHFQTLSDAPVYGQDTGMPDDEAGNKGLCCIPTRSSDADAAGASAACCIPNETTASGACCD